MASVSRVSVMPVIGLLPIGMLPHVFVCKQCLYVDNTASEMALICHPCQCNPHHLSSSSGSSSSTHHTSPYWCFHPSSSSSLVTAFVAANREDLETGTSPFHKKWLGRKGGGVSFSSGPFPNYTPESAPEKIRAVEK